MRWLALCPLAFLVSCVTYVGDPFEDLPWDVEPHCGDGILDEGEVCDEGADNSDETPDACRTSCTLPSCGDGVADTEEECDDGASLGGDGCSAWCLVEEGSPEVEPNNTAWSGQLSSDQEVVHGSLDDFDMDCYRYDVPKWGWMSASILPDLNGACMTDHVLSLRKTDGTVLAIALAGEFPDGCAQIDVMTSTGAQYLEDEQYAICVEGLNGSPVRGYSLYGVVGDDSCTEEFEIPSERDMDGDLLHDACDDDDDGDGIHDEDDNCPRVSNSLNSEPWLTTNKGYIDRWLVSGPYTGTDAPEQCEPALRSVSYFQDGSVTPSIADDVPGVPWRPAIETDDRINFFDYMTSSAPHEAYAVSWFKLPETREAVLSMGADDGFRVWVDGVEIDSVPTCQGVSPDKYKYPLTLTEGWHRLTIRVRDHGGAWGVIARILKPHNNKPMKDLELSIHPYGPWIDDQSDTDGDGIGDVCDLNPNDPDK